MKKYSMILLIALFFVGGCSNTLPTYELEENFNTAIIDGKEYALHKLSYNGKTYISEPEQFIKPDYYDKFEVGKQIGKTDDGMQVHQVKNDETTGGNERFMYPADFFKLDSPS